MAVIQWVVLHYSVIQKVCANVNQALKVTNVTDAKVDTIQWIDTVVQLVDAMNLVVF